MHLWILDVAELTCRWHSGGGLVVIADSEIEARALAAETGATVTDQEWAEARRYQLAGDHESKTFVFPNAGCC